MRSSRPPSREHLKRPSLVLGAIQRHGNRAAVPRRVCSAASPPRCRAGGSVESSAARIGSRARDDARGGPAASSACAIASIILQFVTPSARRRLAVPAPRCAAGFLSTSSPTRCPTDRDHLEGGLGSLNAPRSTRDLCVALQGSARRPAGRCDSQTGSAVSGRLARRPSGARVSRSAAQQRLFSRLPVFPPRAARVRRGTQRSAARCAAVWRCGTRQGSIPVAAADPVARSRSSAPRAADGAVRRNEGTPSLSPRARRAEHSPPLTARRAAIRALPVLYADVFGHPRPGRRDAGSGRTRRSNGKLATPCRRAARLELRANSSSPTTA